MNKLLFLICVCCLSLFIMCEKSTYVSTDEQTEIENKDSSNDDDDTDFDDDDPDEIGYIVDPDDSLEERASTFKIVQVITSDSLPIYRADGKKQKYGKRQIVSTVEKTRFTLRGYGFNAQTDSSRVMAFIKKDTIGFCDIISWSDSEVVVDFPILTHPLAIAKTFSIKFKLFRANDKPGRTNVSRTKSRTCISDVQAATVRTSCTDVAKWAENYRKDTMNISTLLQQYEYNLQQTGGDSPIRGDYMFPPVTSEGKSGQETAADKGYIGLFETYTNDNAIYINVFEREICGQIIPGDFPKKFLNMRFKKVAIPNTPRAKFVQYDNATKYVFESFRK